MIAKKIEPKIFSDDDEDKKETDLNQYDDTAHKNKTETSQHLFDNTAYMAKPVIGYKKTPSKQKLIFADSYPTSPKMQVNNKSPNAQKEFISNHN